MSWFLSFRYQAVGGPTRESPVAWENTPSFALKSVDISTLASRAAGKDVLFAVHGFNNSQSEAVCSLSRLEQLLNLPDSALFLGVLWPGDSAIGALSYPIEKPTAEFAGRYLGAFCNKKLASSASLSFASHSLGARLVLEAIRKLDRTARSVCLTAAAIERTCLADEYADAFANADLISVLASRQDEVLRLAFPLGNVFGHLLDPTANPLSDAMGYDGPPGPLGKTVRPWQITDQEKYRHGDYLPPSNASDVFPNAKGKWNKPAQFIRETFEMQTKTWPV